VLDRPPSRPDRRREQQRRHRQRLAAGRRCAIVEYDAGIVDLLVRLHWLAEPKSGDAREVGCAIRRLLDDTENNS
jgi:hypothetical protein